MFLNFPGVIKNKGSKRTSWLRMDTLTHGDFLQFLTTFLLQSCQKMKLGETLKSQ